MCIPNIETEHLREDGTLICEGDADEVIRLRASGNYFDQINTKRRAVCLEHARFLTSDESEKDWVLDALDVEKLREVRKNEGDN